MSSWWPWDILFRIEQKLNMLLANQQASAAQQQASAAQQQQMETHIMAILDDLEAKVTAEETVEASVVTLLEQLNAELQAAVAANDPARIQAVIDKITADTQTLANAVTANTPPA